jgi:ribonuclease D
VDHVAHTADAGVNADAKMLAKIIVHAPTRAAALDKLGLALAASRFAGLETNLEYLRSVVASPVLIDGRQITASLASQGFVAPTIDVLAPGIESKQLWPRLATKHLVMHGSDFDLRLLHAECGFRAHRLFDTMLAAQLLGRKRVGLASLLEEHFGVQLDKEGQKANWSKRPISPKLRDYAARDVAHLPDLRDLLTKDLVKRGRYAWFEQQCARQIEVGAEGFAPPDENDWRIGRSERLRGKGLTVLHAVWHWREQTAQRLDVPPFKVCSNDILLRYAQCADEGGSEAAVVQAAHLGKRQDRLSASLTAAVRAGLERDPHTLPRRRGRDPEHTPLSAEEISRQDRIKLARDRVAAKLDIEPTLIANRSQLAQIARAPDRVGTILLPWQAELLDGEHLN